MKEELTMALETIRRCRNNMSKQEFLESVHKATDDNNIAFPLLEAASVCSMDRIRQNAGLQA